MINPHVFSHGGKNLPCAGSFLRPLPSFMRACARIDFTLVDPPAYALSVARQVEMAVVKAEGGIYAPLPQKDRLGPIAGWIIGRDKKISSKGDIGRHQIKKAVVIAQGRRKYAA